MTKKPKNKDLMVALEESLAISKVKLDLLLERSRIRLNMTQETKPPTSVDIDDREDN